MSNNIPLSFVLDRVKSLGYEIPYSSRDTLVISVPYADFPRFRLFADNFHLSYIVDDCVYKLYIFLTFNS